MDTILTGQQSGEARTALNLTQRKAASEAGLDRNKLSLFERQQLFPDNKFKQALRDFYESEGMEFDDEPEEIEKEKIAPSVVRASTPDHYQLDGYVVVKSLLVDEAGSLTEQIDIINERIDELLEKPIKRDMFGRSSRECDGCQEELKALMARAYCLVRQLHGYEMVEACPADDVEKNPETQGSWLGQFFTLNGILDDEDGQSDAA